MELQGTVTLDPLTGRLHPTRILLVDDDAGIRRLVQTVVSLADSDLEIVSEAASGSEAMKHWREERPEVIVLDNQMPGESGLELAGRILAEQPSQRVILFSATLDADTIREAERLGVTSCVAKDRVNQLPELIVACLAG